MRVLLGFLLLLALCLPAWSASKPGIGIPAQDRAAVALQRAVDHYQAGKLNEAAGLLRGFVVSQPESAQLGTAYYYLAQIHAELNEPAQGLDYLRQVPAEERGPAFRLLEGLLLSRLGEAHQALRTLLAIDPYDLTPEERQRRWLGLSEISQTLGQEQRALYFLYQALQTEGAQEPAVLRDRVHTLLEEEFDSPQLQETSFMYAGTSIGLQAMLKLGWRALQAGNPAEAREWVARVLAGPPEFAYRSEALMLQAELTEPGQVHRAIGVLLPLSGRYASFGTLVQRGMQLAQETFRPRLPVRFVYRDTAGEASQARQQFTELAIGDRVMAIAGPLVGNAAEAVASLSEQQRVPMLTLSQRDDLPLGRDYVFRNSLTPKLQVRALVEAAMNDMGLVEFGLLTPRTRLGEVYADLFRAAIRERGGQIVAAESYAPDQTDFRRQIRLLQGRDPNAPDEEVQPDQAPGAPPEPPFQALILPDYADRVSLIAPQLAFYGLEGVQLLGTNGWNDPELIRNAGKAVDGAVFTDGFFRYSPYPFVQEFVEDYFAVYGEEPTILEAQGYDTAGILLNLLDSGAIRDRDDLRRALATLNNYPGVTGATRFDHQGEAVKVLFLLQVQDGTIVQIN